MLAFRQLELRAREVRVIDDVTDVEERGLVEAYFDEGGLHPGENPGHPALVDVADNALVLLPLEVELGDVAIFDQRDAGLAARRVDDENAAHWKSLTARSGKRATLDGSQGSRA